MSYTVTAALGVLGALVLDLLVLRTRLVAGRVFWATYPIVLAAQLVSNGILTGRGIVRYDRHAASVLACCTSRARSFASVSWPTLRPPLTE